jgi:hypothetical protein
MNRDELVKKLNPKIKKILEISLPLLEQGTPGSVNHAYDLIGEMLSFKSDKLKVDIDILLPLAILHDIGHAAILPEHFSLLTGPVKIKNSKLIHMLTGAKIAKDILEKVGYDHAKSKEIIDIIAIHDYDQLEGVDADAFNTHNKKLFHDFDRLDSFNPARMKAYTKSFVKDNSQFEKVINTIMKIKDNFFFDEFKKLAEKRADNIKNMSHD